MSTRRVASATSVAPQARKKSPPPPNVPVPKLRTGTFSPDLPSCRNSISAIDAADLDADDKIKRPPSGGLSLIRILLSDTCWRLRSYPRSGGGSSFVQDPVVDGEQRQLQTVRYADLIVDVAQVILDDLLGRAKLGGDFLVLVSLYDEGDDAQFFRREAVAHAQADHIVFGELAGHGDILHPGFAARHLAHAVDERSAGHVAVDHAVGTVRHVFLRALAGVGEHNYARLRLIRA